MKNQLGSRPNPANVGSDVDRGMRSVEPIAIVGMACRFPRAENLGAFWRLLRAGECAVGEVSPRSAAKRHAVFGRDPIAHDALRQFALVSGIDEFDAEFFRMAPLEAELLDPQQRMLLETSWEALEDAGIAPRHLKGSSTGVYVGISSNDYGEIIPHVRGSAPTLYAITGNLFSTASGRIAYVLGLKGPAVTSDTACSSSLVAVHQAVTALQQGETDLALAGGATAILALRAISAFANAGMVSPTGRCWTFDEAADGFVRGEGCGVLVLKRLGEAQASGDRIWAVIRGSAVNQDGASEGLWVPNGPSQEGVIEEALERANLSPSDIHYLEAHGTGTKVGDPTELRAASAVYGRGREADRPLLIGSVKTNIGHLSAAAGIAGLIKVALAMNRGLIPKHLNFRNPTSQVDWKKLPVRVTSEPTDWPLCQGEPARAGVNSFGLSGTNAHVIVESRRIRDGESRTVGGWPAGEGCAVAGPARGLPASIPPSTQPPRRRRIRLMPLSGTSDSALRDMARRYLSWLEHHAARFGNDASEESWLSDLAWTAGMGRNHFACRVGIPFRDLASLRQGLKEFVESPGPARARVEKRVAFLYTGQASQWAGMGRELYESEPVVRAVLDRCDHLLGADRDGSLLDVMFGRATPGELDDPVWTHPAIYALECALTALWKSMGVRPHAVMGHSLGELAAAEAAGVFTLEDGLRFAAARGRAFGSLPAIGGMAAIFARLDQVEEVVNEYNSGSTGPGLSIAAENGMHQVVSGLAVDIDAVSKRFVEQKLQVRRLHTTLGYHSPLVEPVLDNLGRVIDRIPVAPPSVDLVSNVTGQVVASGEPLDGRYWRRHVRETVAFGRGVRELARLGVEVLVEIGPHAVLGPMATLAWPETAGGATHPVVVSSQERPSRKNPDAGLEGDEAFMTAVAGVYTAGLDIEFNGLFQGEIRRRISLPGYAFQRERHWVEASKQVRAPSGGHPLLGIRHESPTGEIRFETQLSATDPQWLGEHLVFGQVVVPGATYGAMAVSAFLTDASESVVLDEMQLHAPLVLPASEKDASRRVELVLGPSPGGPGRTVEVYSRGDGEDRWVKHAAGRVTTGERLPPMDPQPELEHLRASMSRLDVPSLYRSKASEGIELGPSFQVLRSVWAAPGESLAEVALPSHLVRSGLEVHPVLIDGCFQAVLAARLGEIDGVGATYLPFGWDRMWIEAALPERLMCHVRTRESGTTDAAKRVADDPREVFKADLRLCDSDGNTIGLVEGFTIKRATRTAMLSAVETFEDMLYEVVWRESPGVTGMRSTSFLASAETIATGAEPLASHLLREGVEPEARAALLEDLERLSRGYALQALEESGWQRRKGEVVDPSELRRRLQVRTKHARLWMRLFDLVKDAGVLATGPNADLVVAVDRGDSLHHESIADPEALAVRLAEQHPSGVNELALLQRCGDGLGEVLRGQMDPLELLFEGDGPGAVDRYRKGPASRAANRLLADALATLLSELPEGRRIRVLEVGAGTGATTEWVIKQLPTGCFDYCYTDISAGFFADAERRFGGDVAGMEYRALDIERDPMDQGFAALDYDIVIAANVLHATRDLGESLEHCRRLLAPSGHLLAIEGLRRQGWLDLSFGQLDGWWRFADQYRPDYPLAEPSTWRQAFQDAGFSDAHVLGGGTPGGKDVWDRAVIVAQQAAQVTEPAGVWVLAADQGAIAADLAERLATRGQTVLLAHGNGQPAQGVGSGPGVAATFLDVEDRKSWRSLLGGLPRDLPLRGVVHLVAVDGHGRESTTEELSVDVKRMAASALALTQGLLDTGLRPSQGMWIVTRGGQVLERERDGQLAGSTLWGVGKVVAREAAHLGLRMVDLDPAVAAFPDRLVDELMHPDSETHIAYRAGRRHVARLVRARAGTPRLDLPDGSPWRISRNPDAAVDRLHVEITPPRAPGPQEVRLSVDAVGLNFRDVLRSVGALGSGLLGQEACGRIVETGSEVTKFAPGDRVVGLALGTLAPEVVTRAELVARVPEDMATSALATAPLVFATVALAFESAGLSRDDRVLIHAGAGGVGLAAIQWVNAVGAEVLATASDPKRDFLRSLGVRHVFDSRSTDFAAAVLDATGGGGVDVVVNSLTGPGFIEASLSCLAQGGRFVEIGSRNIWTRERMSQERPDVAYSILAPDTTQDDDAVWMGTALRQSVDRLVAGELSPLVHTRWPMAEADLAMDFMRLAKHIGKIVLTAPPITGGRLRNDRTYLITGGLGGIGCAVAEWLADKGAGAIVLNGRRPPDPETEQVIGNLRQRGAEVVVELADVADSVAVDAMLERMDATLPPLAGVIHSVGLLSDGSLPNQSWERLRRVMWPKVLGGWHLHRATRDRDLDMFVLFSSMAGVLGNPGQANHAAANAFLDQLAAHRRALGLAGQSIQWSAWSGLGEAEEQRERIARSLKKRGVGWISPRQGIRIFDQLVRQDPSTAAVSVVDWPVFGETLNTPLPLLEDLLSQDRRPSPVEGGASRDLLTTLRQAAPSNRRKQLSEFLQREVRSVLRLASEPDPAVAFIDLGMDSLMAVELRNRVNQALDGAIVLSNTAVFDHPDINSLTRHLHEMLGAVSDAEIQVLERVPEPPARPRQSHRPPDPEPRVPVTKKRGTEARGGRSPKRSGPDRIAIVGMACRFPSAPDLPAFWRLLESGSSAVTTGRRVDSNDLRGCLGNGANGDVRDRRAAFVEALDGFDADFFRIAPNAADRMDPECRLLMETGWWAVEDAAIDPARLRGSRTGIYIAVGFGEYRDLLSAADTEIGRVGTAGGAAAGRLAALLGAEGPTLAIDAAGASSLVAVHRACGDLLTGEADLALVGAANTVLSPIVARTMRRLSSISRVGRCSVFDASADGFVRGEGCGVVLLKRLDNARADGNRIWGVIRGTAVANSGERTGLTLPGEEAQRGVIGKALSRAGVAPAEVDYLEAHGTGSALTDSIEVRAAAAVLGSERDARRPLLIGSVKTNIGHLQEAAGMAGLIKVVLAMNHGGIPAHLNFHTPTPRLDWDRLPVRVTAAKTGWPEVSNRPVRAGVSALGQSGSSAHVVLEQYASSPGDGPGNGTDASPTGPPRPVGVASSGAKPDGPHRPPLPEDACAERKARVLPLSAKSIGALRDLARSYLSFLDDHVGDDSRGGVQTASRLADIAWTAGVGRGHMTHRAGIVFDGLASIRSGLRDVVEAGPGPKPVASARVAFHYTGRVGLQAEIGRELYEYEPVARAVMDRCDRIWRRIEGASLVDAVLGRRSTGRVPGDSRWAHPATYMLECALTALWSSVGIRPTVVVGRGIGELAAARTAGVFRLEPGLRMASALGSVESAGASADDSEAAFDRVESLFDVNAPAAPSLSLVSGSTGRLVESGKVLDSAYWRSLLPETDDSSQWTSTLTELGVDLIIEIGPQPPVNRGNSTFPAAVAAAYEAGLPVSFAGLFAGETRRQVALPAYPFQRRSCWIKSSGT